MKNLLLGSVAYIVILGGSAMAADMRVKAPIAAAPVPYNWSGCYVGAYGGAAGGSRSTVSDRGTAASAALGFGYNDAVNHSWNYRLGSTAIGGGTLGCNWQAPESRFVYGIEGEVGFLRLRGSAADPTSPNLDTVAATRIGPWDGIIAGRVGYAADRALFYAKAGAAIVPVKASVLDTCITGACGTGSVNISNSSTRITWAAGGGIEYALPGNWSIKGEYLYLGLHRTITESGTLLTGPAAGQIATWTDRVSGVHTAKLGVNYKFDWAGLIAAKY